MVEDEVVKPAVEGTMSVLRASHQFGVKRVVVTASTATISDPNGWKLMYDHEDKVDPDGVGNAYTKSKILAENSAWEFIEELKEKGTSLEMSTIHPAGIIGPTLTKDSPFTSMEIARKMALGKVPLVPRISMGFSDVRDCARAHEKALFAKPYQRYVTVTDSLFLIELATIVREEFGEVGLNPNPRELPLFAAKLLSYINAPLKNYIGRWGKKIRYDSSLAEEHLGFKATPLRESVVDMVNSLIEQGYIELKK